MTTQQEMKQRLIDYYRTCSTGRYGTLNTISVGAIAKNEEEANVLGTLVNVGTYGYTYGTYKGFSAWGAFKDEDLERECNEAFNKNQNRIESANSW